MAKRAAICIGVNRAGTMPALQAAVKGAQEFSGWAKKQGCDTTLLVDDGAAKVAVNDIFDAVKACVDALTYEQLIIYFSGHGILSAPGAEYWLLSRAPENPNEAVNVSRSMEDARNSGIPHVIFVSDACRSGVTGSLHGVSGGSIFPNRPYVMPRAVLDVFYATQPGDPAWEVPQETATRNYRGIFTDFLLSALKTPEESLVEQLPSNPPVTVVTSQKLKDHLEAVVPVRAADLDVRIRQTPEVRPESHLPRYFGVVDAAAVQRPLRARRGRTLSPLTLGTALTALRAARMDETPGATSASHDITLADQLGLTAEVDRLEAARGRTHFETHTGFSVHGVKSVTAHGWRAAPSFLEASNVWHVRLTPDEHRPMPSIILRFESQRSEIRGTILPVLHGRIGSVVVDESGRVTSVNFVPSEGTSRFEAYRDRAPRIEKLRAITAVAARHGRFEAPQERAQQFAETIRVDKALDPSLGLYAAYAYAQAGLYEDVADVFQYMQDDPDVPVPFDVAMLATRYRNNEKNAHQARYAPFAPLLSQGWSLLARGDAMFRSIHDDLRPHLLPSLWTTLNERGVEIATAFVGAGGGP